MSIREQLKQLTVLQAAELELRRMEAELAAIPGQREAEQRRIKVAGERLAAAEAEREDCLKNRRQHESELKDVEVKLDKYRDQELLVKTNEQLWAIQAEMRQAQEHIDSIEEKILEEMENADALSAAIDLRGDELKVAEREVTSSLRELDASQKRLENERDDEKRHIESAAAEVGDDLRKLYERVKRARGGVAIGEALDGMCMACNVRLRPQLYLEVLNMQAPVRCDNCKRILFSREALELPSSVHVTAD